MEVAEWDIPPIEAVVGHWFAGGKVNIVFREEDDRQFYFIELPGKKAYGSFLEPGEVWGRQDAPRRPTGIARASAELLAFHEAGHAVICIDEGIKVEFVTIIRSRGLDGIERLGFCQYDYRLPDMLKQNGSLWTEKTAKAYLGGPWADYIYRQRMGLEVSEAIRYSWDYDRNKAAKCLKDEALRVGKPIDVDSQLDCLNDALKARFQDAGMWDATCEVAHKLRDEGAISGQTVKDLVEEAKAKRT